MKQRLATEHPAANWSPKCWEAESAFEHQQQEAAQPFNSTVRHQAAVTECDNWGNMKAHMKKNR